MPMRPVNTPEPAYRISWPVLVRRPPRIPPFSEYCHIMTRGRESCCQPLGGTLIATDEWAELLGDDQDPQSTIHDNRSPYKRRY